MKKSTISDVARRADISVSTVSNFLNSRYSNMSDNTRRRIEEAVIALNYSPNISARRLPAKEKCRVICLITPVGTEDFFSSFYYNIVFTAINKIAAEAGYGVLIYLQSGKEPAKDIDYLKSMYGTIADGFLLFDLTTDEVCFRSFEAAKIPYICVGKVYGKQDYNFVATDHAGIMENAVDYLASLGHSKIAIVREENLGVVPITRQEAYENAMKRNALPIESRLIATPWLYRSKNESYSSVLKVLTQANPPTALITGISHLRNVEKVCDENGINIPKDLSVIVLDYNESDNFYRENYTHFRNVADDVTKKAFRNLLKLIDKPSKNPASILVPVKMANGDTAQPPRKANVD